MKLLSKQNKIIGMVANLFEFVAGLVFCVLLVSIFLLIINNLWISFNVYIVICIFYLLIFRRESFNEVMKGLAIIYIPIFLIYLEVYHEEYFVMALAVIVILISFFSKRRVQQFAIVFKRTMDSCSEMIRLSLVICAAVLKATTLMSRTRNEKRLVNLKIKMDKFNKKEERV